MCEIYLKLAKLVTHLGVFGPQVANRATTKTESLIILRPFVTNSFRTNSSLISIEVPKAKTYCHVLLIQTTNGKKDDTC